MRFTKEMYEQAIKDLQDAIVMQQLGGEVP